MLSLRYSRNVQDLLKPRGFSKWDWTSLLPMSKHRGRCDTRVTSGSLFWTSGSPILAVYFRSCDSSRGCSLPAGRLKRQKLQRGTKQGTFTAQRNRNRMGSGFWDKLGLPLTEPKCFLSPYFHTPSKEHCIIAFLHRNRRKAVSEFANSPWLTCQAALKTGSPPAKFSH